jgi:uncharacterized protein (TIGR02421 family)
MAMGTTVTDGTLIDRILRAYRTEAHIRTRLPGGGMLNMDRKLPYLFVYRQPPGRADAGTSQLVLGEASYLIASGMEDSEVSALVRALAETGTSEFGSFLVLELWAGDEDSRRFVVQAPDGPAAGSVETLRSGLAGMHTQPVSTEVVLHATDERHPDDLAPLLTARECWEIGCLLLGVEVPPIYRDEAGAAFPVFLRRLRGVLSPVLRQTAWEFSRVQTTAGFASHRALGPRGFSDRVFEIDESLAEIERSYEFLLLTSPMNTTPAWRQFRDGGFEREPDFHYRLLPVDPDVLKRRLYNLDLEEVADPAMAFLLRDKRDELDRQVTMLAERNTSDFRFASIRLYQPVDDVLLSVSRQVLEQVAAPDFAEDDRGDRVDAADFARLARAEIEYYRAACPGIAADVQVRPDLVGLMVSRGNLLVGDSLSLRPERVEALLQHEVGTHVLTYYNGRAQPLRQLCTGLAGYDELQEGLAVFAEYLTGGLDAMRLRVLAARVVAVHCVEHGADFIETFRLLTREHGFTPGTAFDLAERVHASGGFTRDVIYLRGLLRLVEYLRAGGALEPLYIGKIAAKHVDVIDELREREFLQPAPLVPRVFGNTDVPARIDSVRSGLALTDMINEAA